LDAADGREALELIEHDMPAIILTDIIMPNLNGLPERNGGSGGGELADIGMDWIIAAKRYLNLSITIGGSAV
jgi:CheY-like chemotaxis protein